MTDKTSLGDRMKRYEVVPRISLTPRMPMIIRVDGRAFHTYTKRFKSYMTETPWSTHMRDAMTATAVALVREISGAKVAYIQSDEISVLVTDYASHGTQPWFGKVAQKVTSVSASVATAAFNAAIYDLVQRDRGNYLPLLDGAPATFDARAFVVPHNPVTPDVLNYFIWRQQDAVKNSISMLAHRYFSPKQLHGMNGGAKQEMLFSEEGINWNDCEVWQKRGWCVTRKTVELRQPLPGLGARGIEPGAIRTLVEPDWDIPQFTKDHAYIERLVFPAEESD